MSGIGIGKQWRIPDAMWERMEMLLPKRRRSRQGGRPPLPLRPVADGIFYVLRTGCQWKAAPREFGSGSSLHRYFQTWTKRGVFRQLWKWSLLEYDDLKGIQWDWQSMDGAMTKSPLGGKKTGKNPTDRAKLGVKRSLLVEGAGVPIGLEVSGANVPDMRLVEATLQSIPVPRPEPSQKEPQHLALDKGYDYPTVRELVAEWGYTAHIPRRGKPTKSKRKVPNCRSRRWVVERSHSWFNRFRRLLIRWEKKRANYLALLHFACAWITWRAAEVLG